MLKLMRVLIAGTLAFVMGSAQAALIDRGGGLLYDNVLNVTWLQDANYAKTSGYDSDGQMTWSTATVWAANLSYSDSVRGVSYDDWRLASYTAPGRPMHYSWWYAVGDDAPGAHSELSYMYYSNLGLKQTGVFGNYSIGGQKDVGLVKNLQSGVYMLGGTAPDGYQRQVPWIFLTDNGDHRPSDEYSVAYAWAVRSGDVAAVSTVPLPATYTMMLAGLAMLAWVTRCRKPIQAV